MKCLECALEIPGGKGLSNHIKREHSLSGEDYTIKHLYGGTRPACVSCGNLTRYSAFGFKRYCGTCASIAMKEGGSKGGKAEAWYTDFSSRFDRFKFRARDGKSERQVALESKVFKIWGAGSRIMTLGDI